MSSEQTTQINSYFVNGFFGLKFWENGDNAPFE